MLPDDIDLELWFTSQLCGGQRDYLYRALGHTWPGRMAAYCPHRPGQEGYRISVHELPDDLPVATRYWVDGFMTGNLPEPTRPNDPAYMQRYNAATESFGDSGAWDPELLTPPSLAYQLRDSVSVAMGNLGSTLSYWLRRGSRADQQD